MLVFKPKLALFIHFLELVLQQFESIEKSGMGVVLVEDFHKFLFIFDGDALVQNSESCSRLWVFGGIYIDV